MSGLVDRSFRVECNTTRGGSFCGFADQASLRLGQRIVKDSVEQLWDFVLVLADQKSGMLITRVFLCHPDWDERLELACIQSNGESLKVELESRSLSLLPKLLIADCRISDRRSHWLFDFSLDITALVAHYQTSNRAYELLLI